MGKIYAFRLSPGADLYKSLVKYAKDNNIKSGVILSGMGSLSQAILRNPKYLPDKFPMTDAYRVLKKIECPLEVLSLSGNFSTLDDEIHIHGHIVVSTGEEDGLARGGHLVDGCIVYSTAEIILAAIDGMVFSREYCENTLGKEFTPKVV